MKSKVLAIVCAWMLGVGILLFVMLQMQSYASIINDAGVVRGATQRAVKLELSDLPHQEVDRRVDDMLVHLRSEEEQRLLKSTATYDFMDDIEAVQTEWDRIKTTFGADTPDKDRRDRLIALSEEHFLLADRMVLSAQERAETDFLYTIAISLILIVIVSTFVSLLERHHRRRMQRSLLTDPLTGQRNQIAFEEEGKRLLGDHVERFVVYSNVMGFRTINESFGRTVGDDAIRALQQAFDEACDPDEIVAHATADHFTLLLKAGGSAEARMRTLQADVEAFFERHSDLPFAGQVKCGYGAFSLSDADSDVDLATAVSNASAVLKEGVSDQGVSWYDDAFRLKLTRQNEVAQYCDQGIRNEEFKLYLQSQVSLEDESLAGAELLCRWDSPDLGFLAPDRFIPLFEKNGFIAELDFYMLEQALRRLPLVPRDGGEVLRISVNLSRITILQPGFEQHIMDLLARWRVPPRLLEIEVTEGLFSVDEDAVIGIIARLRRLGLRVSMDDFGTGYSSLSLLRKLPIDVLKIDRSFLSETAEDAGALIVLKGVIDLADSMGITTICEGVETQEQAELLSQLGCSIAQGYLYDRPLPWDEFAERYGLDAVPSYPPTNRTDKQSR